MNKYEFPEGYLVIQNKAEYMDNNTCAKVVKVAAPGIKKWGRAIFFCLLYFILYISVIPNYLQMIHHFLKWWASLTNYGLESHVNITEGLENIIMEERIRVGK